MVTTALEELKAKANEAQTFEELHQIFRCTHERMTLARRVVGAGSVQFVKQCTRCGKATPAISRAKLGGEEQFATQFIEALHDEFNSLYSEAQSQMRARLDEQRREKEALESADWRRRHSDLITSPRWKAKRQLVIDRCRNTCECCGLNLVSDIHHIHYRFPLGDEPLWVLRGVCRGCHQKLYQIGNRD